MQFDSVIHCAKNKYQINQLCYFFGWGARREPQCACGGRGMIMMALNFFPLASWTSTTWNFDTCYPVYAAKWIFLTPGVRKLLINVNITSHGADCGRIFASWCRWVIMVIPFLVAVLCIDDYDEYRSGCSRMIRYNQNPPRSSSESTILNTSSFHIVSPFRTSIVFNIYHRKCERSGIKETWRTPAQTHDDEPSLVRFPLALRTQSILISSV